MTQWYVRQPPRNAPSSAVRYLLDLFITLMAMAISCNLLFLWDYTFYTWGDLVLETGISGHDCIGFAGTGTDWFRVLENSRVLPVTTGFPVVQQDLTNSPFKSIYQSHRVRIIHVPYYCRTPLHLPGGTAIFQRLGQVTPKLRRKKKQKEGN